MKMKPKPQDNTPQEGRNNDGLTYNWREIGVQASGQDSRTGLRAERLYVQVQIDQSIHCIWRLCTSNFLGERAPLFLKSPN